MFAIYAHHKETVYGVGEFGDDFETYFVDELYEGFSKICWQNGKSVIQYNQSKEKGSEQDEKEAE